MVNIEYIHQQGKRATTKDKFKANEEKQKESFQLTLDFSIKFSKKHNVDVAIIQTSEGTYVDREYHLCSLEANIKFVVLSRWHTNHKPKKSKPI